MEQAGKEHHGAGVLFVLAGARESRQDGSALFPEILKSEFHGIRSVIEAYSLKRYHCWHGSAARRRVHAQQGRYLERYSASMGIRPFDGLQAGPLGLAS